MKLENLLVTKFGKYNLFLETCGNPKFDVYLLVSGTQYTATLTEYADSGTSQYTKKLSYIFLQNQCMHLWNNIILLIDIKDI